MPWRIQAGMQSYAWRTDRPRSSTAGRFAAPGLGTSLKARAVPGFGPWISGTIFTVAPGAEP